MAIPNGYPEYMKENQNIIVDLKTQCLKLTKAIYGLVQAARQYWNKFQKSSNGTWLQTIKSRSMTLH
jgi:hypothetical protein